MSDRTIEALLHEERTFPPPASFQRSAAMRDQQIYDTAARDLEGFWARAAEELHWFKKWDKVLEWKLPYAKWFVGGQTNISYNCIDRHVAGGKRTKAAIIWEGEPGDQRALTDDDLRRGVAKFATVLRQLWVPRGDPDRLILPNALG